MHNEDPACEVGERYSIIRTSISNGEKEISSEAEAETETETESATERERRFIHFMFFDDNWLTSLGTCPRRRSWDECHLQWQTNSRVCGWRGAAEDVKESVRANISAFGTSVALLL
jgi:hypothetical protein